MPFGPLLTRDHLKKVAKASRHFDRYLKEVRRSYYSRAVADELRDDEIGAKLGSDDDEDVRRREKRRDKTNKAAVSVKTTRKVTTKTKRKVNPEPEPEPESEEEDPRTPPTPLLGPTRKGGRSGTKKSQQKLASRRKGKN